MGRSEEPGTGIRNVYKNSKAYSGSDKLFFSEEDVFVTRVPLLDVLNDVSVKNENVEKSVEKIISLLIQNPQITQKELSKATNLTRRGVEKKIIETQS